MASVKNFFVSFRVERNYDGSYTVDLLDGSNPNLDVTHVFRLNYFYVGNFVYYHVVSFLNNRLGEFVPFKSLTLTTEYPYSSVAVDTALSSLHLSPYEPWMHELLSALHDYVSDSLNNKNNRL